MSRSFKQNSKFKKDADALRRTSPYRRTKARIDFSSIAETDE